MVALKIVAVMLVLVLVGTVHSATAIQVEQDPEVLTQPQFPPEPPKADDGCCGSANITDDRKIEETVYSETDKLKFRRTAAERTMKILEMLKQLQQRKAPLDPTQVDIDEARHLLSLSKVLKRQLIKTLRGLGQEVPELPSQEKTYLDATGKQWGEAEYNGTVDDILRQLPTDEELENRDRQRMYKQSNPPLEQLMEKMRPANAEFVKLLRLQGKDTSQFQTRKPETVTPPGQPAKVEAIDNTCAPPGCSSDAPLAADGTPSGLSRLQPALTVPRGGLSSSQVQLGAPGSQQQQQQQQQSQQQQQQQQSQNPSGLPSSVRTVPMSVKIRYMLATPQCPCGCPRHLCPCKCQGAFLIYGKVQPPAIVSQLPPVEAVAVPELDNKQEQQMFDRLRAEQGLTKREIREERHLDRQMAALPADASANLANGPRTTTAAPSTPRDLMYNRVVMAPPVPPAARASSNDCRPPLCFTSQ